MTDGVFWGFVVGGALLLTLGVAVVLGVVPGRARHHGRWALAMGAGAVCSGIAHYRNLPNDDWVRWVGVGFIFSALFFQWRSRRLERAGRG